MTSTDYQEADHQGAVDKLLGSALTALLRSQFHRPIAGERSRSSPWPRS